MLSSINPYNNNIINQYKPFPTEKISEIIKDLSQEYIHWKKLSFKKRKEIFINVANDLERNLEKHAKMITLEIGKPIIESRMEVSKCVWAIKFFAENAEKFLEKEVIKTDYKESYIQFDPLGVILGVMPWNFPYWQVFRFIVPVLMAGNVCLVKHASNVSGCSLLIEELVRNNSLLKNIYRSLIITSSQVEDIIKHKDVKAVSLTGSEEAGASVAMCAGKEIKKLVLELGGSDPFIVLDDANIEKASKTAIAARFFNTGQSCIAAKRFLVHEAVHDLFIDKVKNEINNLVMDNPLLETTQIGPLAKREFLNDLDKLVQSSIKDGAQCIIGGGIEKNGFYKPTLLINVKEDMSVFKNETFGPVFCVTKIKSVDEAINLANNTQYGLGGSIWTENISLARELTSKINTGALFINDMTKSDPRLPFGGINKSGYGIELSKYGIREFVNTKTIVIN